LPIAPRRPEHTLAVIQSFLERGREPALLEPGEAQFALRPGNYALECRAGRLSIQVWDERRNLVRRIVGSGEERGGRLELTVERFGKRQGSIYLVDLARAERDTERRGARLIFREQFRRFLGRQLPDWRIAEISTEPNLEESLSPAYPRALLTRGQQGIAALASPPEAGASAGALTFGLIWLEYLRRRESRRAVDTLALFFPEAEARAACHRLPFLNPHAAQFLTYLYTPGGDEEWLDSSDYGNIETTLEPRTASSPSRLPHLEDWVERLLRVPHVEAVERPGGGLSLRVRGLEFARTTASELVFGLERRTAAREGSLPEIEALAREIGRLRSPAATDRENPLYRRHPEAWLESVVRANIERIDASLFPAPIYGQAPTLAAGDRGVIDLLAVDRSGRLAVIELKASEDIHLPLQALDYWIRVVWHLERGEFGAAGYFPGVTLRRERPRLLLVAPALHFHPKTEVLLRYFAPGVDVERIGLGVEWRQGPDVMFRMRGAERPA
jgi:hypothetical protein